MNFFLYYIFTLLTMILLFAVLPYITRKTEQFGVSIPQSIYSRTDIKQLRKKYALYTTLLGIVFIIVQLCIYFLFSEIVNHISFIVNIFLFLIFSFLIYLTFHKQMKIIKDNENWKASKKQMTVIDTTFHLEKSVVSHWLYVIPFVITVGTIFYTFLSYGKIPNEIPMHTSINGDVRYDEKTPFNVMVMPAVQLFMIGLFLIINIIILKAKQQINAENPDVSKIQNQLYRKKWSRFLFISAMLMVIMFLYIQLTFIHPVLRQFETPVTVMIIAIVLIGSIVLSIRTGQGGSRIKVADEQMKEDLMDRDEDEHWKLGQFYFNKNDPSIFIEKRFGVGWTNNWANPLSWIFLILLLVIVISVPILLTIL